ncbi:hypothetical protein SLE2022_102940 [Rubroshorea leprosula]
MRTSRMAKKRSRVLNVAETNRIEDEDTGLDDLSQPRPYSARNLATHGKQNSSSRFKNNGLNAPADKKLGNSSPSVQSRHKIKFRYSASSSPAHSPPDEVARLNNNPMADDHCARRSLEIVEREKYTPDAVEAALTLMDISWDVSRWQKSNSHSSVGNHGRNMMDGIKIKNGDQNNKKECCNSHSTKKARTFQKFCDKDLGEGEVGGKLSSLSSKETCLVQRKQKKRKVGVDSSLPQSEYMNYGVTEEDRSYERCGDLGTKEHKRDRLNPQSSTVWREGPHHPHVYSEEVLEEDELPLSSLMIHRLKKVQAQYGSSKGLTDYSSFSATEALNYTVPEAKNIKFSLVSPTLHTGFLFSIIHFLSAIRMAMVAPDATDDPSTFDKCSLKRNHKSDKSYHGKKKLSSSRVKQYNLPLLPIQEIVSRVRLNPGDPFILETQEPLQDLVKGALKIFSSTKAPRGARSWEPLTVYSKSKKSWSWVGPVSFRPGNPVKENLSAEAWGLPHKMLQNLVDSFADWLKSAQKTLQNIGSLPEPPPNLNFITLDVGERLGRLKPRSAGATISPCSEELRVYFRKEEAVRYLVPERAFCYTALDGKKSAVAPLKRSISGKPSSRCREHFMLKANRPPHITVLSLVRDAAARLPDGVGTRADVCILMRDSQYIVEDISEEQLTQVVSGGLDRLHYESDPCVQFDGETRFWVYLHGDRDEDDFDEDGTVSTIKRHGRH